MPQSEVSGNPVPVLVMQPSMQVTNGPFHPFWAASRKLQDEVRPAPHAKGVAEA
jgi:hypothetical protein